MDFLEIETRKTKEPLYMADMQFHDYYELYFLFSGNREVFVENKLFILHSPSFCVIPPYSMHKTEGNAYERTNIYINQNLLNEEENAFLKSISKQTAFSLSNAQIQFISNILNEITRITIADKVKRNNLFLLAIKTILAYMQAQVLTPLQPASSTNVSHKMNPTILQIVAFINKEYQQNLTLDYLSKKFYISKNTLCKQFYDQMKCSPMQYVTNTRINKAKMYLTTTNKNMSDIAELCGFSSANYFSLTFKKQINLSPLEYRKKY